jgi:transposase-like protein
MGPFDHKLEIDDRPITRPLARCPACGSNRLDPVVENERQTVHFLCHDCSRCWHVELGFVQRMTPATCLGCPERARCVAAFQADHEQNRA